MKQYCRPHAKRGYGYLPFTPTVCVCIDGDDDTDDCEGGRGGEPCIEPFGTGDVLCNNGDEECCPTT